MAVVHHGFGLADIFIDFLFGVTSTKKLSDAQWYALARWLNVGKDEDFQIWIPDREAINDIIDIMLKVKW